MSDMPQDPAATPPPPVCGPNPPPAPVPGAPAPGSMPAGSPPPPQAYAPQGYAPHPAPPSQAPYGNPYGQPPYAGGPSKDENTMAMLIHVTSIFTGFLGPLIIWLIKKDESPFVDRHGKTSLNFQFTLLIGYFVSAILFIILIGILTFLALIVCGLVFPIIAAIAANKGEEYSYPLAIKFFS